MTSSEARIISDKPTGNISDSVFDIIREAAVKGYHSVYITSRLINYTMMTLLLNLGYCVNGSNLADYNVSW